MTGGPWRLIRSQPQSGALNMASDEVLLESVGERGGLPILRLYAWRPPTLSLGYAQPVSEVDLLALEDRGWELVRRPTGGRAILHTDELTYAIIAPHSHPLVGGGVMASYQRISRGLLAALQGVGLEPEVGPGEPPEAPDRENPVCFEVPSAYELLVGGKKLIGSAQVRRREGVLQHGTIPLRGDIARICDVLTFATEDRREKAAARVRSRAATVSDLLGEEVGWERMSRAMADGLQRALGLDLQPSELSPSERSRAQGLVETKHRDRQWIERR